MLTDYVRVVCVINGVQFESRVIIHEIIHFLGAHSQCCDCFTNMDGFFHVCYSTTFDQVYHGVCEHFCVDTQIFFISQQNANSIGNTADTQLQCSTVGYFISDHSTDFFVNVCQRCIGQSDQIFGNFAQSCYFGDVDQVVTHYSGHFVVYFQQDDVRFFFHSGNFCCSHTSCEVTVFVHRGNLAVEYIQNGHAFSPVAGYCAVVVGNICKDTLLNNFSACAACEPGNVVIFTFQFRIQECAAFFGSQDTMVLNTCQFAFSCSFADCITNHCGFFQTCGACTDIAGFYVHCNFFRSFAFCLIHFLPFIHVVSHLSVSFLLVSFSLRNYEYKIRTVSFILAQGKPKSKGILLLYVKLYKEKGLHNEVLFDRYI